MSIPPDSPWRGCAANFPLPVSAEAVREAQRLTETVNRFNCIVPDRSRRLQRIVYRSSDGDYDATHHVFRWVRDSYQVVFENGLRARPQEGVPDHIYYDVENSVHHGGRPMQRERTQRHAFVATTLSVDYRPPLDEGEREVRVYRYEIYAPGGIWIAQTLGDRYRYRGQEEVSFPGGIARQYIRSAQVFIGTREVGSRFPRWRRADNGVIFNMHFNPELNPSGRLRIESPITLWIGTGGRRNTLRILRSQIQAARECDDTRRRREKRQTSEDDAVANWYAEGVANAPSYINAAFRSSRRNEAYIFMKNEYALLNYAPGTTDDWIVNGPLLICEGYPSLAATAFGEYGIDCAFDTDGNKAFIFSGNLCAFIDYAPGTTDDRILSGPMTITAMFPFFKGTVFENRVDTAFRSSRRNEAYLFKGDKYALINYDSKNLIAVRKITEGFYGLRGTVFASGIEAAFASHRTDEAYIFKGTEYALINFAPGTTNDYIIGGHVKPLLTNWPSLRSILPRMNRGLDAHDHHQNPEAGRHRVHDEL